MKIFVIGFNKTGTTSFNILFRNFGIKSIHTTKPVMDIIDNFDAFTDGNHYNFIEYYNKYPDSLFILNTRPIYKWLISRYKHAEIHDFKECWCWPVSIEKTDKWIIEREEHYNNILNFFADKPEQLLIVNIEKAGWEAIVAKFIKKSDNYKNKVHKNIINLFDENKMKKIARNVYTCLSKKGYDGREVINKNVDISKYNTYL